MQNIQIEYFKTDYGELILGAFENELCLCDWRYRRMRDNIDKRIQKGLGENYELGTSPVIERAKQQLTEYFVGKRRDFDLPIMLVGSEFQKSVWYALMEIPHGKTETYLGLSARLGNPKAIRAVAAANGANAISIIVPCHRIVGSKGELIGYAGGLKAKEKLLLLESPTSAQQLLLFE